MHRVLCARAHGDPCPSHSSFGSPQVRRYEAQGYDTVSVMEGVLALGLTPLDALRVNVQLPTAVGTPPKEPLG
jgi:hypothetical protein